MANNVLLNDSDNRGLNGHRSLFRSPAEELLDFIHNLPKFVWSKASWRVVAGFSDVVVFDNFRHRLESLCNLGRLRWLGSGLWSWLGLGYWGCLWGRRHSHQHWKHVVHRLRLWHRHIVEDPWLRSLRGMGWEDKVISTSRLLRAGDGQSLENLLYDGEWLLFSHVGVGQVSIIRSRVDGVDSLLHNLKNLLDDRHTSW